MEEKFEEIADRFTAIDGKFASLDSKMEGLDSRMEGVESSLATIIGVLLPKNVADPNLSKNVPPVAASFEDFTPPDASKKLVLPQDEDPVLVHPAGAAHHDFFSTPIISDDRENSRYQHANFRHFQEGNKDYQDRRMPYKEVVPASSYFQKNLARQSFMEPSRQSTFVRTIANVDPTKSGVCLTYLDTPQVYKWSQDLVALQKKHPEEDLEHGLFIARNMVFRINAWNEAKQFLPRPIICGTTLNVPNKELFELILQIVLPKTEQEWIATFKRLVTFRKLPRNQHECPPDTARFDDWYNGIIEYTYEANEVVDLMASLSPGTLPHVCGHTMERLALFRYFLSKFPWRWEGISTT
jgi:hypothetical protein